MLSPPGGEQELEAGMARVPATRRAVIARNFIVGEVVGKRVYALVFLLMLLKRKKLMEKDEMLKGRIHRPYL